MVMVGPIFYSKNRPIKNLAVSAAARLEELLPLPYGTMATKKLTTTQWETWHTKSVREGSRHSIFWVSRNPKFAECERLGVKTDDSRYVGGDAYTGQWRGNKKDGFGTLTTQAGGKYVGSWRRGKRNGEGVLWMKRDVGGQTKLRKVYEGGWSMGKRSGAGTHFSKEGDRYEGEWSEGKKQGRGTMYYSNNDVYEGEWLSDLRCGLGALALANGDRFEGYWKDGVKHGPGRFFYFETKRVYEGEWSEGMPICGEYFESADAAPGTGLPEIQLSHADEELREARDSMRRDDGDGDLGLAAAALGKFSREEVEQLQEAFMYVDERQAGYILGADLGEALAALGVDASPADLDQLLEDFCIAPETELNFIDFCKHMFLIKQ